MFETDRTDEGNSHEGSLSNLDLYLCMLDRILFEGPRRLKVQW